MKVTRAVLINPVTNTKENTENKICHYPNIGDILTMHAVRQELLDYNPFTECSLWSNNVIFNDTVIKNLNDNYDMLILAGGGIFHHCPMSESEFLFRCHPDNFKKIEIPIYIAGVGINQLISDTADTSKMWKNIVSLCEQAHYVSVRDSLTHDMLCKNGYWAATIEIDSVARLHPLHEEKKDIIGIVPSSNIENQIVEIIKSFPMEKFGLISHTPPDYEIAIRIAEKVNCKIVPFSIEPRMNLKYYAQCKAIIGERYHSMILAHLYRIPFINFCNNFKNIAFKTHQLLLEHMCRQSQFIMSEDYENIAMIIDKIKTLVEDL